MVPDLFEKSDSLSEPVHISGQRYLLPRQLLMRFLLSLSVSSMDLTSDFLVYLSILLPQSDLIKFPMKYVVPFSLTGVLLVPIFIDLARQYKSL